MGFEVDVSETWENFALERENSAGAITTEHEWEALEQSLRNKDKGVLKASAH